MKPTHLKNAPIIEALIDIKVQLPDEISINNIEPLHASISNKYPLADRIFVYKTEVNIQNVDDPKQKTINKGVIGYFYKTKEETNLVQFRLDGFTFNKLKPYESWEQIKDESNRLWEFYKKELNPKAIKRIALRYINKIELSSSINDLYKYLKNPPRIPNKLPQNLKNSLNRIVIQDPEINTQAIITQASEIYSTNQLNILIDIDVFIENQNIDQSYLNNNKALWESFENLRNFKNKIFFELITNKTVGLYK